MKSSYKRDMNHNYLVLEPEGQIFGNEYQVRMLSANHIEGLLKCNMKRMDGQAYFYYEVTSKQSLERSFERNPMGIEDISRLLLGVKNSFENVSSFLLNPDNIVMDPEYIYLDIEKNDVYLCYLPSYEGTVAESFRGLSEYILKKLDHNDSRAVAVGYDIYRQTGQENYSITQVIQSIYQIQISPEPQINCSKNPKTNPKTNPNINSNINPKTNSVEEEKTNDSCEILDIIDNTDISVKGITHEKENNNKKVPNGKPNTAKKNILNPNTEKNQKAIQKKHYFNKRKTSLNNQKLEKRGSRRINLNLTLLISIAGGAIILVIAAAFLLNLNATQTGGLIFLILGIFGYLITSVEKRKVKKEKPQKEKVKKKKVQFQSDMIEESADDASYEYESLNQVKLEEELFGETTILNNEENQLLYLISMEPRTRGNIILRDEKLLIGKMKSKVDIVIELPIISRLHARLWKEEGCYYVEDLNSRNGTFINGERLQANEKKEIKPGDELAFATASYYIGSS